MFDDVSFDIKSLFSPLTTKKAIIWIVVVGLLVYSNSLFNRFVWDDFSQIVNSPVVHSFLNVFTFFLDDVILSGSFYRPIQLSFISLIISIFGFNAFFLHLFQVLIHILNTILVFIMFKKILDIKISLFLSIIFLVHPINVESVSYISASSEVLYALFGLMALNQINEKKLSISKALTVSILLLLSILSKESGVVFLFLLPIYYFLINKSIKKTIFLSCTTILAFYLLLRIFIVHSYYVSYRFIPIMNASLYERLITIPNIIVYYLKTFVFPKDLAISQQWVIKNITFTDFYLPVFILSLFILVLIWFGFLIYKFKKSKILYFLFYLVWFVVGSTFYFQIIPLTMTVADRWFYVPMIGLLGIIGMMVEDIKIKTNFLKTTVLIFAIFIIVMASTRTIIRNTNWYDSFTLYSHDISISKSFFLESDLGLEYLSKGERDKAITHLERSISSFPFEVNFYNLGLVYAKENNLKKANYYFKKAVEHYTAYVDYVTLTRLLLIYDDLNNAKILIQNGLSVKPNDMNMLVFLGIIEYKLKNKREALNIATKVYSLYPNDQTLYLLNQISNDLPIEIK